MTDSRRSLRPDARLVGLHAERGDPQARLGQALANLEGAEWALLFASEDALAAQLAFLLGGGTLRVDGRLRVTREALANAGLAVASLDGDWHGARAVWLLEPDQEDFQRAQRADVPVIVDGTLAPGGQWFGSGAEFVTYRDSVTLSGHGDAPLAALFGLAGAPEVAAAAPSDLSVALVLRDISTLPLRLARAARTVSQLADRLRGAAQLAGPTALHLAPDAAPDTPNGLGGVMAAARSVTGGMLLTPGLDDVDTTLTLLHAATQRDAPAWDGSRQRHEPLLSQPSQPSQPSHQHHERVTLPVSKQEFTGSRDHRRDQRESRDGRDGRNDRDGRDGSGGPRRDRRDDFRDFRRDGPRRTERSEFKERGNHGERPQSPSLPNLPSTPGVPERVVFEAPPRDVSLDADPLFPPALQVDAAVDDEETWEPEIVFSDIAQEQVRLPIPVSSGPDAPNLGDRLPDVLHQPAHIPPAETQGSGTSAAPLEAAPDATDVPDLSPDPSQDLSPDLPKEGGKEDPASSLTEEQAAIYARLRDWRNVEAKRQAISRFIIASNATLAEIAKRVPYTAADLKAVKGMGPERMKKYGEQILEVVRG